MSVVIDIGSYLKSISGYIFNALSFRRKKAAIFAYVCEKSFSAIFRKAAYQYMEAWYF
jgi:hypothetical protein